MQTVSGHDLRVLVGTSEATVAAADTDYLERATAIKQEWDKKSLAEKRAKLIAESPMAPSTETVPAAPAPTASEKPVPSPQPNSSPSNTTVAAEDKEPEKLTGMNPEKKKLVRFLTSGPIKWIENGRLLGISYFKANGTYMLGPYEGKWKFDGGELVTYCNSSGKLKVNRYVFEEQFNKCAGQRDRKSEVQDQAVTYLTPQ